MQVSPTMSAQLRIVYFKIVDQKNLCAVKTSLISIVGLNGYEIMTSKSISKFRINNRTAKSARLKVSEIYCNQEFLNRHFSGIDSK